MVAAILDVLLIILSFAPHDEIYERILGIESDPEFCWFLALPIKKLIKGFFSAETSFKDYLCNSLAVDFEHYMSESCKMR